LLSVGPFGAGAKGKTPGAFGFVDHLFGFFTSLVSTANSLQNC